MGLPSEEQETSILFTRNEKFATVYASDSTSITKLDRLCKQSPTMWKCIEETKYGKRYICEDKSLISFRSKKAERNLTDEQREQLAERLRKARG